MLKAYEIANDETQNETCLEMQMIIAWKWDRRSNVLFRQTDDFIIQITWRYATRDYVLLRVYCVVLIFEY